MDFKQTLSVILKESYNSDNKDAIEKVAAQAGKLCTCGAGDSTDPSEHKGGCKAIAYLKSHIASLPQDEKKHWTK